MLRSVTLLAGVLLLTTSLQAQITTWLSQGTSIGYDQVYDVVVDDNGNSYLYGQAEGGGKTLTFGTVSQTINANQAGFIAKLNAAGTPVWLRVFETNFLWPYDIAYGNGQLAFTGQYSSSLNLGITTIQNTGISGFLARMDTSGQMNYTFSMNTAYSCDAIAVDDNGHIILAGHHQNNLTGLPGCSQLPGIGTFQKYSSFVTKIDLSQQLFPCIWSANINPIQVPGKNSYFNRPDDVAVDSLGNVYVVGEFVGGFQFAGNTYTNPDDSSDTYILKYTSTGTEAWATVSSGIGHFFGSAIEDGPNQTVIVGGNFSTGGSIGNETFSYTTGSNSYLLQLDAITGNTLDSRYVGSNTVQIYDIDADLQGNLYVTGEFGQPTLNLGNGVSGTLPNNNQGGYVAAFDAQLTAGWVKVWGACCSAAGWGLELDPTENRLLVGGYYFGDMTLDGQQLISTGQNEAFVANIQLSQPSDSVWPGDANDDLIANNLDLLQVGLAFGSSGPARPNATTNWTAQFADLWGSSIAGIDMVHADTDGNGLVDAADTLAINLNYGLTHNKGTKIDAAGPLLAARFLNDSLLAGDTATIIIELGTGIDPAFGVYGLAFSLQFDTSLVDASTASVTYGQSWLGSLGTNMIKLDKIFESDGQIDFALARTDQQATSGYGEICRMTIIMVDDLTAKDIIVEPFTVALTDVTVIDELGGELGATTASDTVIIYQDGTDAIDPGLSDLLILFPIPADDRLSVRLEGARALSWQLMDLQGARITENRETRSDFDIDISSLAAGTYFFLMNTDRGIAAKKILIK